MQAIIDASANGRLQAEVAVVISNNSQAGALKRARTGRIPWAHLSSRTHPDPRALDAAITGTLRRHKVELVVLAGYMRKLERETLAAFAGRIINTHPSLLPAFGGQGMYGLKVHEAVLAAGESASGATIHLVEDSGYDQGQILAQEVVAVAAGDTPEALQARVLAVEHRLYAATLARIAQGEIALS